MKILQIGKYSPKFAGGMEKTISSLSECMSQKHKITVITNNPEKKRKSYKQGKVIYDELPCWNLFSTPISPSLPGFLKSKKYDIIQLSHPNPMASLAYLISRPKGKLVIWYHYDIVKQRILELIYKPILNHILKKASCIVTTSDNYLQSSKILRNYKSKTVAIPHGINYGIFNSKKYKTEAQKLKSKKPLILFVGRLVYYKGIQYLIKAMQEIDAQLLIIGQGPLEKKLKSLVRRLNLEKKVTFKKVPAKKSLAKYYHACDVFVLPSIYRSEAFGIVLLEAMACAKPVITTELGTGTSFVCKNNVNGLVVAPKDVFALKSAIIKIINNKKLAAKFGQSGRKMVENQFNIKKMGERFLDLYDNL